MPSVDIAVDQQVLDVQRSVLEPLMSETVAQRLLDNEAQGRRAERRRCTLAELYATLHARDLERARRRARTSR